jgi:hypothetical protein
MVNQVQYLTPEGYKQLESRLKYLLEVRRAEVAERLRQALEEGGDLSENAEYEDAKNEQAFVEGEILRLETILSSAQVIEESKGKKDHVAWRAHHDCRKGYDGFRSLLPRRLGGSQPAGRQDFVGKPAWQGTARQEGWRVGQGRCARWRTDVQDQVD